MSAKELKLRIINKVDSIEDELMLEEIYKLVNLESSLNTVYKLTDAEKTAVATGLKDITEGRVFTSEAAQSMMKEWLKK